MQVLRGREAATIEVEEIAHRRAAADRVVIDIGTGDARWAYRLARSHPDWLVVGLDPAADRLREIATRLARKPAKGGLDNLWLVAAAVERAPAELRGLGDELHVLLPWGTLLRGTVLGDAGLLGSIAALGRPGASLEVVLGADIWDDPVPRDIRELPTVDLPYVEETLIPRYAAAGLTIETAERLAEDEWRALPSSWARRLAHGRHDPKFVRLRTTVSHRPHP